MAQAPAAQPATPPALPSPPPATADRPPAHPRKSYFRHASVDAFASGLTAGLVSTMCLHPFDLIKTRLQVAGYQPPPAVATGVAAAVAGATPAAAGGPLPAHRLYRSSLHAARSLVKHEGWSALYKGIAPNLVGNTIAWGLYFFAYDVAKRQFSSHEPLWIVRMVSSPARLAPHDAAAPHHHRAHRPLNALEHILAASITGVFVSGVTNPLWVVKTRMFLDHTPTSPTAVRDFSRLSPESRAKLAPAGTVHYRGLVSALQTIWLTEGVSGLYRGFVPGLFGVSHGAVQFMVYEELKKWRLAHRLQRPSQTSVDTARVAWTTPETIAMSIASKAFAACATYPYQVIRSRMQGSHQRVALMDVIRTTWRAEGVAGFYRGLWVNLVKVMPAACTVFVVYEKMSGYMKKHATTHDR